MRLASARRPRSGVRCRWLQTCRQPFKDAPCGGAIARGDAVKGLSDGSLDRSVRRGVDPRAAGGEPQHRAPSIARIVDPAEEPLRDQPLQHARERAGMHVQDGGEVSCRHTRKETDDAEHEPLRPGDPHLAGHTLRGGLESMHHGPEQLHELQHGRQVGERISGVGGR